MEEKQTYYETTKRVSIASDKDQDKYLASDDMQLNHLHSVKSSVELQVNPLILLAHNVMINDQNGTSTNHSARTYTLNNAGNSNENQLQTPTNTTKTNMHTNSYQSLHVHLNSSNPSSTMNVTTETPIDNSFQRRILPHIVSHTSLSSAMTYPDFSSQNIGLPINSDNSNINTDNTNNINNTNMNPNFRDHANTVPTNPHVVNNQFNTNVDDSGRDNGRDTDHSQSHDSRHSHSNHSKASIHSQSSHSIPGHRRNGRHRSSKRHKGSYHTNSNDDDNPIEKNDRKSSGNDATSTRTATVTSTAVRVHAADCENVVRKYHSTVRRRYNQTREQVYVQHTHLMRVLFAIAIVICLILVVLILSDFSIIDELAKKDIYYLPFGLMIRIIVNMLIVFALLYYAYYFLLCLTKGFLIHTIESSTRTSFATKMNRLSVSLPYRFSINDLDDNTNNLWNKKNIRLHVHPNDNDIKDTLKYKDYEFEHQQKRAVMLMLNSIILKQLGTFVIDLFTTILFNLIYCLDSGNILYGIIAGVTFYVDAQLLRFFLWNRRKFKLLWGNPSWCGYQKLGNMIFWLYLAVLHCCNFCKCIYKQCAESFPRNHALYFNYIGHCVSWMIHTKAIAGFVQIYCSIMDSSFDTLQQQKRAGARHVEVDQDRVGFDIYSILFAFDGIQSFHAFVIIFNCFAGVWNVLICLRYQYLFMYQLGYYWHRLEITNAENVYFVEKIEKIFVNNIGCCWKIKMDSFMDKFGTIDQEAEISRQIRLPKGFFRCMMYFTTIVMGIFLTEGMFCISLRLLNVNTKDTFWAGLCPIYGCL